MPKISKVNLAASVIGLTLLFTIVTASVFWTLAEEERLPMMIGANSIAFVFAIAAWNGVFEQKVGPMTWVGWLGLFFLGGALSLLFLMIDCGGHLPAFHPEFVCNGNPGMSIKLTLATLGLTVIALPSALRAFIIEKFDGKY